MISKILEVKELKTSFFTSQGEVKAVRGISFYVEDGETIGIVGESGSGKSVTALSIMKLQYPGKILEGKILYNNIDLMKKTNKEIQNIRGKEIAMIFQDANTAFNPVFTIGNQIEEALIKHQKVCKSEARTKAVEMLKQVGISSPEKRVKSYPHELSGGMIQRAMIAMALSCKPRLLIADEPTAALDVTIQAQILQLIEELKNKENTSVILITHDLRSAMRVCTRILVMYGGLLVEEGTSDDIFYHSKHPYTRGLIKSIPKMNKEPLVPIEGTPIHLLNPPNGCPFITRCPYTMEICKRYQPPYFEISAYHRSMCWLLHEDAPKSEKWMKRENVDERK